MRLDVTAREVPQGAVLLVGLLPVKINKRLARDVPSPRNLTLFMTSLTQTAGHKRAAVTVVFSEPRSCVKVEVAVLGSPSLICLRFL